MSKNLEINTARENEALRIALLYDRTPEQVLALMDLHGVDSLPVCRFPNDGYGPFVSDLTSTVNLEPSLTKQEFTESSDPNWIIDRHARGQDVSMFLNSRQPIFGDTDGLPKTLHEAMNITVGARQQFEALPSEIRSKFGNNPVTFMDFAMNPANAKQLYELGLLSVNPESPAEVPSPASENTGGGEGA